MNERVMNAIKKWDRFPQDQMQKITLDSRFKEDLGMDSLDGVEMLMSVEEEFGFEVISRFRDDKQI